MIARVLRRLTGWFTRTGCSPATGASLLIGAAAERRAARHLRWRGWRIVARNWIGGGGELDIVASRWRTLLIVEVRRRDTAEQAFVSVDADKLTRTQNAAAALVRRYGLERYHLRFDVIAVDAHQRIHRHRDIAGR